MSPQGIRQLLKNDILVGTEVEDDGMPAEFDICPLLHVATIETVRAGTDNS